MLKFLKFIPVQLTFFLVSGIIVGFYFYFNVVQLAIILGVLIVLLLFAYLHANNQFMPSPIFSIVVFLLSFFMGVSSITYKNQLNKKLHYYNSTNFSTTTPLLAVISIKKVLKPNAYYTKYEAEVIQLNKEKAIGKILINFKKDSLKNKLQVDDKLLVNTLFLEIKKPLNPHGFNYKKYLQNQQIYHQINSSKIQVLLLPKRDKTIKGIATSVREIINEALVKNGFKNDELAVINALLLGQRQNISRELQQNYAGAGVIHILAVSGLHIGIILLILTFLFKPLHYFKNGKIIALFFVILILWGYAIIAGLSASVVRAVTMFTAVAIGMSFNRPTNVYNTLVISMFFLLLFNPYYLFEVGFQLSYLAVFSIVWIQPKLYGLWRSTFWLPNKIWQLFTVSIAAQIGVLPLSLFYFHQFPGLFFLSNLVIIPFLGIILIGGIVIISLSVLGILPLIIGNTYSFIIQQMNNFVAWVSFQEAFLIQNISFSFALLLAFYACFFLVIKWIEKKGFYRFLWVLSSVIIIQSVFIFERYKKNATTEFIVFNKSKKSLIGVRTGNKIVVSTSIDSLTKKENALKAYLIGTGVNNLHSTPQKNLFKFYDETILVIDSLGIYKFKTIKPTIVILQGSPKINIERLIEYLQPKMIIADGSNYKSRIKKWEATCLKKKTPFYSTMQKGAFVLSTPLPIL